MVKWFKSNELVDYDYAVNFMEARASDIASNKKKELIWLVEHPPLYTGGASAKEKDLLDKDSFPVYRTRRGGKFTYRQYCCSIEPNFLKWPVFRMNFFNHSSFIQKP